MKHICLILCLAAFPVIVSAQEPVNKAPEPIARFAGKTEGEIEKSIALATDYLVVEVMDFSIEINYSVKSFTLGVSGKLGTREKTAGGNKLTPEMKTLLSGCKKGDLIYFSDIMTVGPDGKVRKLKPISFTII